MDIRYILGPTGQNLERQQVSERGDRDGEPRQDLEQLGGLDDDALHLSPVGEVVDINRAQIDLDGAVDVLEADAQRGGFLPVNHQFGALVPIYGTLVTAFIAMLIAVPVSFGIALFLTEVAPPWLRTPVGSAIELLAGIPSIIYGMWACSCSCR